MDLALSSSPLLLYMTRLQTEYAKRCYCVCQVLREASQNPDLDFGFEFCVPRGGYFLWVTLTGTDFIVDEAFRTLCLDRHNVDFKTGRSCSSAAWQEQQQQQQQPTSMLLKDDEDEPFLHSMRLCFAYYDIPTLTKGLQRLCLAIQEYSKNPHRTFSRRCH